MFLLSLSCLVILFYIMIFVHLVVLVLCIFLLMNDINLLLNLLSVFFLVMLSLKRVMFIMIPMFVVYRFLEMWFYLEINIFFHLMLTNHLPLYPFCLVFLIPQQLWKGSNLALFMKDIVDLSLMPLPLCSLLIMTRRLILLLLPPLFVGILVLFDPLIGIVSSSLLSLLLLLYPLFSLPLATNRPCNMSVGKMQCKHNFKHLRRITLGILFLILLQSNLLGVNGFSL
jgi:hypothetical protein